VHLNSAPQSAVVENHRNWVDCIKSGKVPNANVDIAVRTATAVHLGNIATRLGRTIHFDPTNERIIGDDDATKLVSRKYREGGHWGVPADV
jgi:hypothetical protein